MTVDRKGRPLGIVEGVPRIVENAQANVSAFFDLPAWVVELQRVSWLPEKVIIADPLSYCAGVERANRAADKPLDENPGQTVYFYHAPIHNRSKVEEWIARGAKIVNSLDEVPDNSIVLFSAHGVGPSVWLEAKRKHLRGIDATCPLVDKTHREIKKFTEEGYKTLLIGKKDHDEIIGTVDYAPNDIIVISPNISFEEIDKILEDWKDVEKLALGAQTTLDWKGLLGLIDYIQEKRPDLRLPNVDDVCYATQNRQEAVIAAVSQAGADLVVVFGSDENKGVYASNNSISLREVAKGEGVGGYLAEDISEIKPEWLKSFNRIGISAGASAPPERVVEFLSCLRGLGLRNDQILRVTVAYEDQIFADPDSFDFS